MRTTLLVAPAFVLMLVGIVRADDTLKPDDEGFIRDWLVLAPLPYGDAQSGSEALAKQQVRDEAKLKPKEGDKVKVGDKQYTWKKHKSDSHLLDLNALLGQQTEDSVAYAVCYLVTDEKLPNLTLKTGSDDQAKVYLNGKEVFKNEEARPADKDQDSTPDLTLAKGYNTIVFKIVNEKVDWSGCLRFTNKEGDPVKRFKVVLKPEGKTEGKATEKP
jgi:hypothetical protein